MKQSKKILTVGIIIGLAIILMPLIITGHTLKSTPAIGNDYSIQILLWGISPIIGLLVLYDSIKLYMKKDKS